MKTKFLPFFLAGIYVCFTTFLSAQVTYDSLGMLPLNTLKADNLNGQTDVWKLAIHGDGDITIAISQYSKNINYQLYDRNGVTPLAVGNPHTDYNATTTVSGLAAGTYYIHAYCDLNQTSLYGITATLAQPAVANDTEPNNTPAQALTLPYNGSVQGHAGYYYNNHRDTADWYKVTLGADGELKLTTTKNENNSDIVYTFYDHDASTVLFSSNTGYTGTYLYDGLAAGSYYVKVNVGNVQTSNTYTLSDSLITYNVINPVPGKYFKQAPTLLSNTTATGHIGFYYNNQRDTFNTYKLNYTGNGNLTLTLHLLPNRESGQYQGVVLQVYKDTTADPIYSSGSSSDQTANLTSLAKGYYYIKVHCIFPQYFMAYSIANSFTQKLKAVITVVNYDSISSCNSTNSISYKCTKSEVPYTVQLYRFGQKYGSIKTVNNHSVFTFSNLPDGLYYATAFADGATGKTFGTSDTVNIMPSPVNPHTNNIQMNQAKLNWTAVICSDYYTIQYRVHGITTWNSVNTNGNVSSYVLKGLSASTTYDWKIASVDSTNGISAISSYTNIATFTTASSLIAGNNAEDDNMIGIKQSASIMVSPNPATSYFVIHHNDNMQQKVNAILYDVNGKAIWTSGLLNADVLNGKQVNVNQFGSGLYYLKIIDEKGAILGNAKISITK